MSQEQTSRYGPLFWASLVAGWATIAFGIWTVIAHAGATRPIRFGALFFGVLAIHDGVVAPVTLGFGLLIARRAPAAARTAVQGALIASALVVAYALPLALGLGTRPDASVLPRNYGAGLGLVLALIWLVAAALAVRRMKRRPA